ncbi:MAG: leucyl aminopeptidase, partial [Salinibacterium sp.]|nr:leucyl aminopeptidase [Salinibacterium sp.]
MTLASLHLSAEPVLSVASDVLVVGVASSDAGPVLQSDDAALEPIRTSLGTLGISGSEDEVRRIAAPPGAAKSIALVGLGSTPLTANLLRRAAGSAVRQLTGAGTLSIALPTATSDDVLAILEGAAIGSYSFTRYRSKPQEAAKLPATDITVLTTVKVGDDVLTRAGVVARALHDVRDLVNTPPIDLYPESFAAAAKELSKDAPVA